MVKGYGQDKHGGPGETSISVDPDDLEVTLYSQAQAGVTTN